MSLSISKPTTNRPKHNQLIWSTKERDDIFWLLPKQHFPSTRQPNGQNTVTSSHGSGLLAKFRSHTAMLATFSEGKYLHVETRDLFHASHV